MSKSCVAINKFDVWFLDHAIFDTEADHHIHANNWLAHCLRKLRRRDSWLQAKGSFEWSAFTTWERLQDHVADLLTLCRDERPVLECWPTAAETMRLTAMGRSRKPQKDGGPSQSRQ